MFIVHKKCGFKVGNSLVELERGQYSKLPDAVKAHRDFKLYTDGGYIEGIDTDKDVKFNDEQTSRAEKLTSQKHVLKPDLIKVTPDTVDKANEKTKLTKAEKKADAEAKAEADAKAKALK